MTTAGSISLGVEIDASDLKGELTREVIAAMGPVLAELNTELGAIGNTYDDVAKKSKRSADQQVRDNKRIVKSANATAAAIRDAGVGIDANTQSTDDNTRSTDGNSRSTDANTKSKRRAKTSNDGLANSIRSVTDAQTNLTVTMDIFGKRSSFVQDAYKRMAKAQATHTTELLRAAAIARTTTGVQSAEYQRLARAAEISAERQIAAASRAAASKGGSGGGGPGVNAGGFMRGGKGRFGFLTSPVGVNAIALGVGSFPALATGTMELVGALQTLAQVGAVVPGVIAGIAATALTAKLGFMGLSDGVTAFWEAAKSGDPADLEKAEEAIKELAPAVQDVARLVGGELRPEFIALQQLVGQKMFEGLSDEIRTLTGRAMPTMKRGLGDIAGAWNSTLKEFARVGGSDSTLSIMDRIFGNTAEGQRRANAAIEPLVKGIGTLAAAGSDSLPRLGDALTSVSQRFSDFVTKADSDGRLDKWIDQALTGVGNLGETFLNIGKMITALTKASGTDDGGFLQWLRDSTTSLQELMNSADGQSSLREFFSEGRQQLSQWGDILRGLMPILRDVYNAMQQWADILLPVLEAVVNLIGMVPGGLEAMVIGFLAFKTLSPFTGLLGQLGQVNTALGSKGGGGILGKLASVRSTAGLSLALGGVATQTTDGSAPSSDMSALMTVGGFALAGSAFGPVGIALGTLAGAVTATAQILINENARMDAEFNKNRVDNEVVAPPSVPAVIAPTTGPLTPVAPPEALAPGTGPRPTWEGMLVPPTNVQGPGLPVTPQPISDAAQGIRRSSEMLGQFKEQVVETVRNLGVMDEDIRKLPNGNIEIKSNSEELAKQLEDLGLHVTKLPDGTMTIRVNYLDSSGKLVNPAALGVTREQVSNSWWNGAQPKAEGGPIWGGVPGKDSVPVLAMPGEHMLTTSDVNAMGGHAGVMAFRRALHGAPGYETGGPIGFADMRNAAAGPSDDSEIGLLRQIRDLLKGTGGGPLADTASATTSLASDLTGNASRDPIREMQEAAISALGGDPAKFLGPDPRAVSRETGLPAASFGTLGSADLAGLATALSAFAKSGDLADVQGIGLNANDPVISAVTSARNKKKGGLSDEEIAALIEQVVGGSSEYAGVLDEQNTPLIKSLQRYREQQVKAGGGSTASLSAGMPSMGGMDPVSAFAAQADGGKYVWGGSDLAEGLSDCSGAVSDLVELITKGQASPERLFSTADAREVLTKLGAVEGAVPGALQIGWDEGHMRSTLPNGVNFESGGGTGQGATYGGNAKGAAGMPNIMSLDAGNLPPGMMASLGMGGAGNPLGYSGGGPVPVYIVNGPGGMDPFSQALAGGVVDGAGQALQNVVDPLTRAALDVNGRPLPANVASTDQLLRERNPFALASLGGIKVGDYGRAGGEGGEIMRNDRAFMPDGDLISDTGALSDRTATSTEAAAEARQQQMLDVLTQTRDQLSEQALLPILQTAVTEGMGQVKEAISRTQGEGMGSTAGPIIAEQVGAAVKQNMPAPSAAAPAAGGAPMGAAGALAASLFAEGGPVYGGKPGVDSVPALLMPGEHVFDAKDVALMGGQRGVYQFRNALNKGKVRGFATGGGVVVNDTVGAEFFGVAGVPILGAIVNMLVKLLLAIIGVEIESRDTLKEVTDEFRGFRGEWKAYDATGRLLSDTSALTERSDTSEETAAAERIRILKIVIEALIKFVIEKIIAPIVKAVANSAIQAGAAAAGAAVNSQAPGAGGIVSSLISSAGTAAVEVGTEFWSTAAVQATPIIVDLISELLGGLFPNLVKDIFSGNWLTDLFKPVGDLLGNGIGGLLGGFAALFGGLGGAATDKGMFDYGGIANGVGLMPKNTIPPERVLSPRQTQNHERLTDLLDGGALDKLGSRVVHVGGITVIGSKQSGEDIGNYLSGLLT